MTEKVRSCARAHLRAQLRPRTAWIVAITAYRIEERLRTLDAPSLVREDYDRHTCREFAAMIAAGRTAAGLAAGESRGGLLPAQE